MASSQSEAESELGRSSMSDHESSGPVHSKKSKKINKGRWTKEEDVKLKSVVELVGSEDWKQIASYFDDRSDHQCLHRWQKVLNPELVKGAWTKDEDERVVELVRRYGPKRWSTIAQHLPGRIGKQCRERWHNHLNPAIKKTAWTEEEDQIIYTAHSKMGNKWAEIAKMVPGRTDNAIKNHWNSTMKKRVETRGYEEYKENRYRNGKYSSKDTRHKERRRVHWSHVQTMRNERLLYPSQNHLTSAPNLVRNPVKETVQVAANTPENTVVNTKVTEETSKISTHASSALHLNNAGHEILSPLRTITDDLKELFDLEPNAWGELTSFDSETSLECSVKSPATNRWNSPNMTGYRFDGRAIASLQASTSRGSLIPITSPLVANRFRTPPAILRKGKKRRLDDINGSTFNDTTTSSLGTIMSCGTPQSTPIKTLPFSPSQFFNSPITVRETSAISTSTPVSSRPTLTSTPVCTRESLNTPKIVDSSSTFRTPKIRRSLLNSPRTPTPLKEAMAAFQSPSMPITSHLEQDITDIIERDEAVAVEDIIPSLTNECPSTNMHHSLDESYRSGLPNLSETFATPSQPLVLSSSDENMVAALSEMHVEEIESGVIDPSYMSPLPSSAVKPNEVFGVGEQYVTPNKPQTSSYYNTSSPTQGPISSPALGVQDKLGVTQNLFFFETPTENRKSFYKSFQEVACGQTADQKYLTEQARQFVYRQTARSLKFASHPFETEVVVM